MHTPAEHARLYLNDREVGDVVVRKCDNGWGFGEFCPNENFSQFAPIYGKWALLMHADEDEAQLSEAASEELRVAEYEMDAIRAKLLLQGSGEWRDLMQVNIDGPLIEWKQR
jgi:hypothetical protein